MIGSRATSDLSQHIKEPQKFYLLFEFLKKIIKFESGDFVSYQK